MARNAIETGLIGIFKKMLRLSIRHMDPLQVVRTKGTIIPIDTRMFDPDLAAEPNVGLGNASYQERAATLNFVLAKQEAIMAEYGMDNPFTGLAQIYNTIEDLVEIGGLKDTGRYFNIVTPTMEEKIAQAKAKADAEAAASMPPPMDPSTALLQVEEMRSKIKAMEVEARSKVEETKIQLKAAESAAKLDLDRDKMAQDRVISLREETNRRLDDRIKQEQAANGPNTRTSSSDGVPEPASNARSTNSVDKS